LSVGQILKILLKLYLYRDFENDLSVWPGISLIEKFWGNKPYHNKIRSDTMNIRILRSHLLVFTGLIMLQCSRDNAESVVLVSYPVNSMEGVISLTDVSLDTAISYDGNGSLEFSAQQPTTFTIYETGDLNVEDCRLIYQAKIRTRNIQGAAYLEMWCHFPGKGEYFSRALNTKLSGDNNWNNQ
jgi:hypothetical protein